MLDLADKDFLFCNFCILVHEIIKVLIALLEVGKNIYLKISSNGARDNFKFNGRRRKIYFIINSQITDPILGNLAITLMFLNCAVFLNT